MINSENYQKLLNEENSILTFSKNKKQNKTKKVKSKEVDVEKFLDFDLKKEAKEEEDIEE